MKSKEQLVIENLFLIPNKEGETVPFILNEIQAKLLPELTGRDIITKARQEGVSSLILALFTVKCLYKQNTRAVVISHDKESTERLFKRVKFFLENMRGPKAVLETSSKREFSFPKTDSVFYIGTAGGRKFGRGDTITDLHCSEVAFWDNAKDLMAGLFQAVPRSGFIGLESTGNGRNFFYRRAMNAAKGTGRYRLHFLDWLSFEEYNLKLDWQEEQEILASLDSTLDEDYLYKEAKLSPGQIKYRREKLEELDWDLDLFKQEYPMTLEECFKASGKSIFHKVNYVQSKSWQKEDRSLYVLKGHPDPTCIYGIGGDVGAGVGQDSSVLEVFNLDNGEQVAEWADDKTPPDIFARRVKDLGILFNKAFIVIESNNHGLVTINELRKIYPAELIYKKSIKSTDKDAKLLSLGHYVTSRSKPLALGKLRTYLANADWKIYSEFLKNELDTFIEDEAGKLRAEDGSHDDRVMACAALAYGWEKAQLLMARAETIENLLKTVDPFTLEGILDEKKRSRQRYLIGAT